MDGIYTCDSLGIGVDDSALTSYQRNEQIAIVVAKFCVKQGISRLLVGCSFITLAARLIGIRKRETLLCPKQSLLSQRPGN